MRPGGMGNPMKALQKMQAEMAKVQEELAEDTVEASVGGGAVKVTMSGDLQVRAIAIDPKAVDPTTSRCWRTWSAPPSTRRCAWHRTSPAPRWPR